MSPQTIVRKVRGGGAAAADRFVVLAEVCVDPTGRVFTFLQLGPEMTTLEVCAFLLARGISEPDALTLLEAASASFDQA